MDRWDMKEWINPAQAKHTGKINNFKARAQEKINAYFILVISSNICFL